MARVIRIAKNRNYTVMSNYHLRDKSLSLKAKGLLSVMLSLPDDWDFSNKGLSSIVKEGVGSVGSGLRELEAAGYITRTQLHDEKGKITDMEYVIYEKPHNQAADGADEPEPASDSGDFFAPKRTPYEREPHIENRDVGNADKGNCTQINTKKQNTEKLNTDCNNYPPINNGGQPETENEAEDPAERQRKWIDRYNKTISEIKEQIDYESLIHFNDAELVNNIVNVMAEVMLLDVPYYTIEGKEYPTELVRINYKQITYGKLEAFLIEYGKIYRKIGNAKKYLITALYNIPLTADAALSNRVNHDMYGGA